MRAMSSSETSGFLRSTTNYNPKIVFFIAAEVRISNPKRMVTATRKYKSHGGEYEDYYCLLGCDAV
jgi:hypothetical protein